MIKIVNADTGREFDLPADLEFDVEMNNPIFEDDGVPVPFSTDIGFPPTPNNKDMMGYSGLSWQQPRVREIPALIIFGGIVLFRGLLEYSSIEDGTVNYSFEEKAEDELWQGKIWASDKGLEFSKDLLKDLMKGKDEDIKAPLLVNEDNTEDQIAGEESNTVPVDVKYQNWPMDYNVETFTPAISLYCILQASAPELKLEHKMDKLLHAIMVLGLYKASGARTWESDKTDKRSLASTLPDVSAYDFIVDICKLLCMAVFQDGKGGYIAKSMNDIVEAEPEYDWSGKISDDMDLRPEEKKGYRLAYSDDEHRKEPEVNRSANGIRDPIRDYSELGTIDLMLKLLWNADKYMAIKVTSIGDWFSLKGAITYDDQASSIFGQEIQEYLVDRIFDSALPWESEDKDNVRDRSISWKLVKCIPSYIGSNSDPSSVIRAMSPVVPNPTYERSAERSSDVYFGIWSGNSLTDKGHTIEWDEGTRHVKETVYSESLAPQEVYAKYHKSFASWLAGSRSNISADLNLTVADILDFQMWQKVWIRGHSYIVKKLTLSFSAGSDRFSTAAELVSC